MAELTIFTLRAPGRYSLLVRPRGGRNVCVRFEPVTTYGKLGEGEYCTTDGELVDALKKHPAFGVKYFIKQEGCPEPARDKTGAGDDSDPRELLTDPDHAVEEKSVTSIQMANNWLQKTHGTVFEATRVRDIKAEAARRYNTIFVNW